MLWLFTCGSQRIGIGHLFRLELQHAYQHEGSPRITGVGWDCLEQTSDPIRLRHVLAAMWFELVLGDVSLGHYREKLGNGCTPTGVPASIPLMPVLEEIGYEEIVTSIMNHQEMSGPAEHEDIEPASLSSVRWRRNLARVVELRSRRQWICSQDSESWKGTEDIDANTSVSLDWTREHVISSGAFVSTDPTADSAYPKIQVTGLFYRNGDPVYIPHVYRPPLVA
jgi:hypothetical protein